MCDTCVKDDEKTILLEIRDVHDRSAKKYEESVDALTKAMGFDAQRAQKEVSPFRAVRDLENLSKKTVEEGLLELYRAIISSWVDIEKASKNTFILNGRIFLNPKSGKPMTKTEWAIIKKDILKAFDYIYAVEEERIALHAMSLGKVLKGLPLSQMVNMKHATLTQRVDDTMLQVHNPQWFNATQFAQQHAAEHIVDLKQKQYTKIHDTIQTSIMNKENPGTLKQKMFEKFGEMNRDWRMIAETEISNSQNNGRILTELDDADEGEYIFMEGVSASGACPFCRNEVDHKIVVVLPDAPAGSDQMIIDGKTYTAIWPGKSNVGRNRRNWWVSTGTQHPHCRCTWVRYIPGYEEMDAMFRDAMEQAAAGYTGRIKLPEPGTTEKLVPWKT